MTGLRSFAAFTLLELLVVVAIIVILLAVLMPGLDKALDRAQTTKCMAQFEGLQTALGQFLIDNAYVLPHHRTDRDRNGNVASAGTPEEVWWGIELLRYGLVPESFHNDGHTEARQDAAINPVGYREYHPNSIRHWDPRQRRP